MTPADLLAAALRRDASRPLVTWYDDGSAERVELSVATAANWAAKTANLLVDDHDLGPGDRLRLDPAGHWLAAVAALGAWTAGVALAQEDPALSLPADPQSFMATVLPQPDALLVPPPSPDAAALVTSEHTWSLAELGAAARQRADATRLPDAARVLSVLALDTREGLDAALLLPLVTGGSVVLVTNADAGLLPARATTERVTHTAGVTLGSLPVLSL